MNEWVKLERRNLFLKISAFSKTLNLGIPIFFLYVKMLFKKIHMVYVCIKHRRN